MVTGVGAKKVSRLFLQSHRTGPVPNGCGLRDLCLMGMALVLRMLTYFKQEIEAEKVL